MSASQVLSLCFLNSFSNVSFDFFHIFFASRRCALSCGSNTTFCTCFGLIKSGKLCQSYFREKITSVWLNTYRQSLQLKRLAGLQFVVKAFAFIGVCVFNLNGIYTYARKFNICSSFPINRQSLIYFIRFDSSLPEFSPFEIRCSKQTKVVESPKCQ